MYLNEFLNFKLGVAFDDMYNIMVIKEVLNNKDRYPSIYQIIENEIDYNDNDEIIEKDYYSSYFDCDDEDCAGYNDTIELYSAFLNVLLKDIKDKKIRVRSVSFGVDYLRYPSVTCIINQYLNYSGMEFISLNSTNTNIYKEIFVPNLVNGEFYGHRYTEATIKTFFDDNNEVLNKIKEGLNNLIGISFNDYFKDEDIKNNKVDLGNDIYGYKCDSYEIAIGDNLIKLYSTKRSEDKYSFIREEILKSLTSEERSLEEVARIEK